MKRIIVTNFTDPVCVWCWAMEPVFRALETRYPMDIELRYVMGGLVRDITDFDDPDNGIGGDISLINRQVSEHWLESAARHHMPVMVDGMNLFTLERRSSYPQGIAYRAAMLASPDRAGLLLRRLRDASIAGAQSTNDWDVIRALARASGIDMQRFDQALADGSANSAFQADLGLTAAIGVSSFPTFQIKTSQDRRMMMRGYLEVADFHRAISQLTDGELQPLSSPPDSDILLWLIRGQGRLALEEVYQAFDFDSRSEAHDWLQGLIEKGLLTKEEAGTSYFVRAS